MSTPAAKRRERQKIRRREEILDAAERVFGEKGPSAATMDDVAEAAEVSKGTVYLYFESKDDLFVALTHRPMDAVLARFAELVQDDVDGLTLIRRLIDTHQATIHAHASQMRLAIASICGSFEPDPDTPSLRHYGKRIGTLQATYLGAIQRGIQDGSLKPGLDPHEVAAALWAGMFGASFIRMNASRFRYVERGENAFDLDRIHESVAKLLMSAIASGDGEP